MIDLTNIKPMRPRDAAKHPLLSRGGKALNISTLYRYMDNGILNRAGQRIKLEYVQTPAGRITTAEAIENFISALNQRATTTIPSTRGDRIDKAEAELAASGI